MVRHEIEGGAGRWLTEVKRLKSEQSRYLMKRQGRRAWLHSGRPLLLEGEVGSPLCLVWSAWHGTGIGTYSR
jgi:hypothetical protein